MSIPASCEFSHHTSKVESRSTRSNRDHSGSGRRCKRNNTSACPEGMASAVVADHIAAKDSLVPHTVHDARFEYTRRSAHRAVDDPAALARAIRIVRAAIARDRVTLDELTPLDPPKSK